MWKTDKIKTIAFLIDVIGVTGMLKKIKYAISGYKTYGVAAIAIVTAVITWSQDGITTVQLVEAIFAAITAMTLKAAIDKSGPVK